MPDTPTTSRLFFGAGVVEIILERTAKGEPLTVICAECGMPSRQSWYTWCSESAELADRFASAQAKAILVRRSLTI